MSVSLFLQLLANGIMSGGTYALVASGLTLTLGVVKVFNFAQGDFLMLGAYLTFAIVVTLGLPYPIALLAAFISTAALGALIYLGIIQRALRFGFFNPLLITVLLVTIIEQTSLLTFADQNRAIPPVLPGVLDTGGSYF